MRQVGGRAEGRPRTRSAAVAFGALAAICSGSVALPTGPFPKSIRAETSGFGIVLIDFDSFLCTPCQAPLTDLCRAVPGPLQEERLRGVLVFKSGRDRDLGGRKAQIVRTKWKGFKAANDIRFPAVLDTEHVFDGLAAAGIVVLLFDGEAGLVRRYAPPFKPGDLAEIVRFLSRGEVPL